MWIISNFGWLKLIIHLCIDSVFKCSFFICCQKKSVLNYNLFLSVLICLKWASTFMPFKENTLIQIIQFISHNNSHIKRTTVLSETIFVKSSSVLFFTFYFDSKQFVLKIRFLCRHEPSVTFPWWQARGFKLFLSLQNVKTNQNFRISLIFTIHTYQCQSLRCVFIGINLSLFLIPVQFNGMYLYKRPSSLLSAVYVVQSFQMLFENKIK